MKKNKTMSILVLIIVGGISFFVFMLYAAIKTKSTNLKGYEPYKELMGKTVVLQYRTTLFEEKIKIMTPNDEYPYLLLDERHPEWQYAEDNKKLPEPDLIEIISFPVGTKFTIEKATQYTNGVSGMSSPSVFGTINSGGKEYKVFYRWGKMDISKYFDKIKKCWKFHQAPWQIKQDPSFYVIKKKKMW